MLLSQVKIPAGEAAVLDERRSAYMHTALAYLNKQFATSMLFCSSADQEALVRLAYDGATRRGFLRERDHLRYLCASMYLGVGFESDPQHRSSLVRAGWLQPNGALRQSGDFDALFALVNHWLSLTACDCRDGSHLITKLRNAVAVGETASSTTSVRRLLEEVWPDRMEVLKVPDRDAVARTGLEQAARFGLRGGDAVLCAALGVHLGYWFHSDPQYPDLGAALRKDGTAEDRRLALADAISQRLNSDTKDQT